MLDAERCTLTRAGEAVKMDPKAFDVLRHLVRQDGHLVTYDELIAVVFTDRVSMSSIHNQIGAARRAIGQRREDSHPIVTVHARGYRFEGASVSAADATHVRRSTWQRYALSAAQSPRTADEVIRLADALVFADMERHGPL